VADTATLSSKHRISIPKAVRESRRREAGQRFVFLPKGDGVLPMPVPRPEDLRGIAPRARRSGYRDRDDRS
jgi:bifunctional DNA-binding transcriptional regulator/antitoxin component of YhaV-PrlF toxin-antitoxin module